jgi:hypothetical protein
MTEPFWPNAFMSYLTEKQARSPIPSFSKKWIAKNNPIITANIPLLYFASSIENVALDAKKDITNYINPFWCDNCKLGSGETEEGKLILLRDHFFITVVSKEDAKTNVKAFVRREREKNSKGKAPADPSKSKFKLTAESSSEEIDEEIERMTAVYIADYENEGASQLQPWYPNFWLTFYLFGLPKHGVEAVYSCLTSAGSAMPVNFDDAQNKLKDANPELQSKKIRRGGGHDDDDGREKKKATTVVVQHQILKDKPTEKEQKVATWERMLALLNTGGAVSDDDFSVSAQKSKLTKKLFRLLEEGSN